MNAVTAVRKAVPRVTEHSMNEKTYFVEEWDMYQCLYADIALVFVGDIFVRVDL